MRLPFICLSLVILTLGCNRTEETGRKPIENNQKQAQLAMQNDNGTPDAPATEFTHVIAIETEYYTSGPQQGRPADGTFPVGTKIKIVEDASGYLVVQSEDGIEGYVAASAVQQRKDPGADIAAVVEASNHFALDLYQQLRTEEGNMFFSPSSISTALAMAYAGSAGATETEMAKTLHFRMPKEQLHDEMQTLQQFSEALDEKKGARLNVANRLWGQERYEFLPQFLQITREKYGAELAQLNFAQSEDARQTVNQWVEDQTENKITELIPQGALSSDTRLVLTNAIYFHGVWSDPFKMDRTKDEQFHLTAAEKIKVPMMHRSDEFQHAATDDLQLLELP